MVAEPIRAVATRPSPSAANRVSGLKILDRYLAGAVIGGTLLTLAVLLPLLGVFLLADEIDRVGQDGYGFVDVVLLASLSLPRYAYQVFPIATLIGALVGLGALASRSELVAMRAAGVSIACIVRAALMGGLLLAVAGFAVGEAVAPVADQKARQWRAAGEAGQVALQTPYGFWARDGDAFVYIREILPGGYLRGIHIYQIDPEGELTLASRAEEARYQDGRWLLREIARSRVSPQGVEVSRVAETGWDSLLDPRLLDLVVVEPERLPLWALLRYMRFMGATAQDAAPYAVAFWGKLVHPLLILAMVFIALPILFGSARTTGVGLRIVAGILVGIVFYLVSRTFSYLSLLYEVDPMLGAVTPPLLFLAGALWLLRRVS